MDWLERSYAVDHRIARYEANEVALTRQQVAEMYAERALVLKECPHLSASRYHGTWTDCGYGLDRHWPAEWVECDYCKRQLDGGARGDGDDNRLLQRGLWNAAAKSFK